jgi:glycosyltransferase involved in cell wall biosynthesis
MKRMLVGVLKKILPQKAKSKLKVFLAYHPYVASPLAIFGKKKLVSELEAIIRETSKRKGIVICPPTIDWHTTLYQRPHQMARAFAREGYLVLFCTNNIRFDNVKGFENIEPNLYLINNTAVLRDISKGAIVLISWAINKFYADRFKDSFVIYEYMDELNVFDGEAADLQRDHDWLVHNADLVVATADKLYEEILPNSRKALLVPNGVDVSHFENIDSAIPTDMKQIVAKKTPIVGYYGALAEWFDYDMIKFTAEKKPEWSFVLIGPLDYDKSLEKIKSQMPENVYFLGAKKYDDLPSYGNLFDVATIPFKINKITESTSPIKLFEYMALGKPIVTTNMPECRKYQSVLIAKDKQDFVIQLEAALQMKNDAKYAATEIKEANENSWQNRAKAIIRALQK